MPSNEVAVPAGVTSHVLASLEALPALSVEDVAERTLSRMLNATTAEELFRDPESTGLRDLVGQVVVVHGIDGVLDSSYDTFFGKYVVLDCESETTGARLAVTTGSPYVITAVLRALEAGLLPKRLRVLELESQSHPGQTSLWLVNP